MFTDLFKMLGPFLPVLKGKYKLELLPVVTDEQRNQALSEFHDYAFKTGAELQGIRFEVEGRPVYALAVVTAAKS